MHTEPTPTDMARDLTADIKLCEEATPPPWNAVIGMWDYRGPRPTTIARFDVEAIVLTSAGTRNKSAHDAWFTAAAREGWPAALRRALAAEAEVERLKLLHEGVKNT